MSVVLPINHYTSNLSYWLINNKLYWLELMLDMYHMKTDSFLLAPFSTRIVWSALHQVYPEISQGYQHIPTCVNNYQSIGIWRIATLS